MTTKSNTPKRIFIKRIPPAFILNYFTTRTSIFRHHQYMFLEQFGKDFTGTVIEFGCEEQYKNDRFFPNADIVRCTNIKPNSKDYLDITAIDLPDNSQDGYICISVLEHVKDYQKALSEILRTLKPNGRLLITVPFIYPRHDVVDYWRFSENFYTDFFDDYDVIAIAKLGGRLATMAGLLQKPYGKIGIRLIIYKIIGFIFAGLGYFFEVEDDYPAGYGIYLIKK